MKRLAILLLAAVPALGVDTPIVTVIGPTEFEIPATEPARVVDILPQISFLIANDPKPEGKSGTSIKARVLSVSVGAAAHPEYGKAFEFGSFATGKKGSLRELSAKVNLSDIPDPQTYVVKVVLLLDGDPTVPPQTLDFKFTRAPGFSIRFSLAHREYPTSPLLWSQRPLAGPPQVSRDVRSRFRHQCSGTGEGIS